MNQPQPGTPINITSARRSRSDDIKHRQTRYLISMGIRTACFVLAVLTPSPYRWFFVAGALFLPYVAVVLANTSDRREVIGPPRYQAVGHPQLEAAAPRSEEDHPVNDEAS
ncbi:MAG: DUF3099 domain-containing protein [Nocardioidaceae bacterium]